MRTLSLLDKILVEIDQSMRVVHATAPTTERPNPAEGIQETAPLSDEERKLISRLMRINHTGEVSAQGLYRGQAMTANRPDIKEQMDRAAMEENDHLNWTDKRLQELGGRKSLLNPFFYWGSFAIGAAAGKIGDKWSLGFVKETEDQVIKHLEEHINRLPAHALADMAILQKMKADEAHHGDVAMQSGGAKLPLPVRKLLMPLMSKVMTKSTYYV
ncbi:MAG TPA: 2-polyprenyl-3-methyl-6-methoxy-1,4-benzoquinone monooxygenase [Candidatus Thiothrix moscowensis]|uniref:2-polyprenyl-3-methyl-6-methoxy-1,4-benzoquinone monooxygenase n=1 Tax=unclassified Thiothrix TaxID=2636184 RepID=UPI0025FD9DAD|nr:MULTISPECIES: 2-polyprenyl-3-methyl-6-methoxy-1,4-benzoquinone monooxygenase [unclassified Thiothrix]HRJ53491.1 2-polyprenyl-3-methyl-6-methoxy-1,4-benzoquinone monooxygenase [Candidatus Thiothrix moscowensis]HRJ93570.1 2-polyprenyl-3-methyl-6-methoxy-1,4-benzoquinone monooxygenase [Candidatus Thiothrix moscowensis]